MGSILRRAKVHFGILYRADKLQKSTLWVPCYCLERFWDADWARTDHKNERSIALMKRIGMRIGIDSRPDAWPGVLGVLDSSPSALRLTGFADSGDR